MCKAIRLGYLRVLPSQRDTHQYRFVLTVGGDTDNFIFFLQAQ